MNCHILRLFQADEKLERRYELKHQGYNLDRIAARVAKIYGIQPREILFQGRQQLKVKQGGCFVFGLSVSWGCRLNNWPRGLK